MKIEIKLNAGVVSDALAQDERQARYALSRTINSLTLAAQSEFRRGLKKRFNVRRDRFAESAAKVKQWATQGRLASVTKIEPLGGPDRASIWTQHQDGGPKIPDGSSLAIPDQAKLGTRAAHGRNKPSALDFKPHGRAGRRVMRGKDRRLLIRTGAGKGVILRRVGHGKSSRLVRDFNLVPRAMLDARLEFPETYLRVVRAKYRSTFNAEFAKALDTAK